MLGGSNDWYGGVWSNQVFERHEGQWIKKCNLLWWGRVHYINSVHLPTSTDAVIMDTNKTAEMNDQCLRIMSPINAKANLDSVVNVLFPDTSNCWNVSMRFQFSFNLQASDNCSDTFVEINSGIGKFCGANIPYYENMNHVQFVKGQTLNIHFKIGALSQGDDQVFMLKLCREQCCYMNGEPSYWQQWGQWSYIDDNVERSLKKRERSCHNECDTCPGMQFEADTDNMVDTGNNNHKYK